MEIKVEVKLRRDGSMYDINHNTTQRNGVHTDSNGARLLCYCGSALENGVKSLLHLLYTHYHSKMWVLLRFYFMFLKELSHVSCIYLIRNTVKTLIL